MESLVTVHFGIHDRTPEEVERILAAAEQHPRMPPFSLTFAADAPQLEALRTALKKSKAKWRESIDYIYTDEEIKKAPLVRVALARDQAGTGGPSHGTRFDLSNACPKCGTGATPVEPFRLLASEVPSTGGAFQTFDGEWFFDEDVAERLRAFSGIKLISSEDARSGRPLPWFQAYSTYELPPMHPATTGLTRHAACPECGRDGYFGKLSKPLLIVYDGAVLKLDGVPDVTHTFEHFGRSRLQEPFEESTFAQPILIVKTDVAMALRDAKVRKLDFYPVMVR